MANLEAFSRPFVDFSHLAAEPSRADVWAANAARTHVQYRILAEAEPDTLCRLFSYFAQQLMTPQQVNVQQSQEQFLIEVQQADISWHRAEVIAQKMRSLVSVFAVELEPCSQAGISPAACPQQLPVVVDMQAHRVLDGC
ncbi:hypothetical protein [uncultured Pseudomonas sp.]|uniref:hypothetical protein n=1 Tax=uncultured Pseudomonas sp. TaxID=114707 RepID=UPI002633E333|nr:hypothetical protein [uncultured Pseudomonas sp.]